MQVQGFLDPWLLQGQYIANGGNGKRRSPGTVVQLRPVQGSPTISETLSYKTGKSERLLALTTLGESRTQLNTVPEG